MSNCQSCVIAITFLRPLGRNPREWFYPANWRSLRISNGCQVTHCTPYACFPWTTGKHGHLNFNIALNKTSSRSQESFKLSFVPSCSNFLKMIFPKSCRFVVLTPCQQYLPVSSTWCNILSSFTRCKTASGPPRRCKMGTKSWKNQVWSLGFQHIKLYLLLWDHRCLLQL